MRCKTCHYSLEGRGGLTEHRCPECGRGFDPNDPKTFDPYDFSTLLRVRQLFLLMAGVFVARMLAGRLIGAPYASLDLFDACWFTILIGPVVVLFYLLGLAIGEALQQSD